MHGFYWHKSEKQEKHFGRRMSLQYCRGYNISTNFCSVHASYRKQQEAFETAQRSAATIMTSMFPFCVLHHIFSSRFIILSAPTCTNTVSYTVSYLLLILHDVAGKFKHKLILLYNCCHNNAFPGLSSTYKEKCSWMWKNRELHWGPAGQKGRITKWIEYQSSYFLDHQCSWVLLFSKQNKPRQILSWIVLPTSIAFTTVKGKIKKNYH